MTLERRCVVLAAAGLAGQLLLVLSGADVSPFAGLGTVAAIGAALVPWLPDDVRARPLATAALVLPVGALVLTLAVIAASAIGLALSAALVLAIAAAALAAGAVGAWRLPALGEAPREPTPAWAVAGLAAAVGLTVVLGLLANSETPFSGNDWAKYLLYAEQVRREGELLIDNPFWLLGQPFREDPGLPALYGSLLLLTGGSAAPLVWGILVLMALSVLAVFAAADVLFGHRAAVLATLVYAMAPAAADMSAWHGAANTWGLVLMPLVLLTAGALLRGWSSWRWALLGATALVGLVCAHRLTASITLAAAALLALGALVRAPRPTIAALARVGAVAVPVAALPLVDLLSRSGEDGGLLPYTAYLDTKLTWSFAARDLTYGLVALGLLVLVAAVSRARRGNDPVAWLPLALLAAVALYAYGWVFHLPGFYARAAYFLPMVLALLVAVALGGDRPWRPWLVRATVVALAVAAAQSVRVAGDAGEFYRFTDQAALRGYDLLLAEHRPGEIVVADRCTSFLSTYLLRLPVLAALRVEEVGPAAELPFVREAQRILRGGPQGAALVRKRNARWLLLNANCPGRLVRPPSYARVRYVSNLLVIYRLEPEAEGEGRPTPRA